MRRKMPDLRRSGPPVVAEWSRGCVRRVRCGVWTNGQQIQPPGARLVYLDPSHWIYLVQAVTGHRDGACYRDALDARQQVADGVVVPLAAVAPAAARCISRWRQPRDLITPRCARNRASRRLASIIRHAGYQRPLIGNREARTRETPRQIAFTSHDTPGTPPDTR
jgi:hypothetical protein